MGFRPPFSTIVSRAYRALGVGGYAGAGALVALLLLGFPVFFHVEASVDWILLGVLGLLGSVPAIDSAVALVNQGLTRRFGVAQVPGLKLRDEVPANLRTLVVVPTLLTRPEAVIEQVERMEIHHLASIGGEIQFALLSDWPDAASETVEGDDALLQTAVEAVARLNRRHPPAPGGDRFLLLHRRRVWNESQRLWIGWERKRGKLHELNRLLRGAKDTTFLSLDGRPPTVPKGVQYVITLDADTRLPPDTVRRLIGKMAHPLNQPIVDPASRRVIEGYAILQPRVTPNLPVGDEGSAYQRAFSSPNGIDPYSAAVSDVYQDLFGEGSYAGKGIYAVDAFESVLADRVPDSTLLSHDLFEGVFARAGLASDVEVVESYPARYDVASLRYHRWARGDWQLLPWILGWSALLGKSRRLPAKMPASGRWKMVDNLRRSVTPLTCVLALLAGWALPFDAALVWTLFFLATIGLPSLSPVLASVGARHPGIRARVHFARVLSDFGGALAQVLLIVTLLAHQAWLMADAVIRTLIRLFVTRRNLLQWTPGAQATIGPDPSLGAYYRWMAGAVITGVVAIAGTWLFGDRTVYLAAPFALLWIASPAVARWVSRPSSAVREHAASETDRRALRLIARRTWRYFETFVTPGDNMLPPDNFQEEPAPVLARRTSPTNLGLYLLSTRARMISAGRARSTRSSGSKRPWRPWPSSSDIAAISTIGTIRKVSAPSTRNMSLRSTAAISRDISSRSPTPARIGARRPLKMRSGSPGSSMLSASFAKRSTRCGTAAAPRPSPGVSSTNPSRISSPKRGAFGLTAKLSPLVLPRLRDPRKSSSISPGRSRSSVARMPRTSFSGLRRFAVPSPATSATSPRPMISRPDCRPSAARRGKWHWPWSSVSC